MRRKPGTLLPLELTILDAGPRKEEIMTTIAIELPPTIRAAVCPLAALARAEGVMTIPDKCLGEHSGRFAAFGTLADCALHIAESNNLCDGDADGFEMRAVEAEADLEQARDEKHELEDQISELEGKIEDLEKERCDHE